MNWRRSRRRREARLLDTLAKLAGSRRRTSLPVGLWRWRKELALLSCAAVAFLAVAHAFGLALAVVGLSTAIGALSPPCSDRLRALGWHLITPHLLRAGLHEARIQNTRGHHPVIVRITREPFGERVRIWCPPGTCAEDLAAEREVLRAACWAADVLVKRDKQRSQMVTVDVIRRLNDIEVRNGFDD